MGKGKRGSKENPITTEELDKVLNDILEKPIVITAATIKDDQCNYGYEIKTGPGAGDKIPTRKGSSFVHEDMLNSFLALRIHLAIIDDAFKYSKVKVTTPDAMQDHEITELFTLTGFKISGSEENEGYILIGEKWVTHGSISLETPKMSSSSGYPFFSELKEAVENARTEVEQYMNGKSAPVDDDEKMPELPFPSEGDDEFKNAQTQE